MLAAWFVALVAALGVRTGLVNRLPFLPLNIPPWEEVAEDGEFAFLPPGMPSLQAEDLYKKAFPRELLASNVVIVARREGTGLTEQDRNFIDDVLAVRLEDLEKTPNSIVSDVRTFSDRQIGSLLVSQDEQASLVLVQLTTEFLEHGNRPTVDAIEALLDPQGELRGKIPAGLSLSLSGSATVGRDMLIAQNESAQNTEGWTIALVVTLLLLIYRAPFLAAIPLVCVFVAVQFSVSLIVVLSHYHVFGFHPFQGLKTYITVVSYGAGVDYCLFLIARYKEELDRGAGLEEATKVTLSKVGAALAASAGTVACGIGMMTFAQFGKFQQAGMGMSLSLVVMLVAAMTFAPALLRWAGSHAFWPTLRTERVGTSGGWIAGSSLSQAVERWVNQQTLDRMWEAVGRRLLKRPGTIWLTCFVLMLPFAAIGVWLHGHVSYGLLTELPSNRTSVVGAKAVQEHFPAGDTGPISVLLENRQVDFNSSQGRDALEALTERLADDSGRLELADIRSVSQPLGKDRTPSIFQRGAARRFYISQQEPLVGKVARLELISQNDPFMRNSLQQLNDVELTIKRLLAPGKPPVAAEKKAEKKKDESAPEQPEDQKPEEEKLADPLEYLAGTTVHMAGTTASLRDVRSVTDQDQVLVDGLVLFVVFLILCALLGKPAVSAYLVISVFFSYFVALGFTMSVFYLLDPQNFPGLDWKVPVFLFTILIAVGEDYNIFLMARIHEEQAIHGPLHGIRYALAQTGGIISSCGVIMAGTFFSLVLAGSLAGMQQLGFAMTFGVLLDTFVVRPLLVPAYLVMLESGRFGWLGVLLGGHRPPKPLPTLPEPEPGS